MMKPYYNTLEDFHVVNNILFFNEHKNTVKK
jgi:hypothetical protein